ncbi:hypothetical protein GCM10022403_084630 [Streptomyces coacervatus]|uniref:Transposase n=1 Tax=Streptomyces coacervatus TaxID=647381 RepID=A0ABP7JBD2_9ACTN
MAAAGRAEVQVSLTVIWGRPFALAVVMPMRRVRSAAAWAAVRVKETGRPWLISLNWYAGHAEAAELPMA